MIPDRFTDLLRPGALLLAAGLVVTGCSKSTELSTEAPRPASHEPQAAAQPPAPAAAPAARPGQPGAGVTVTVRLSPELKGKASPNQALYIFARATQGPAMPLAVVRKQVKDLPVTVTLDDSTAMMPDFKLSTVPEYVVGARITQSGDVIAKPGDLEGFSPPTQSKSVEITIASVVGSKPAKPGGASPHAGGATFNHAASGGTTRLNIPADVKATWKNTELAVSGPGLSTRTAKVAVGGELKLENGLVLKVLAYVPAFQSDSGVVTSASNNPDNPAVLVQLVEGQQVRGEGWVFQKLADFNTFASDRLKVKLVGAGS